jgi:hypothetical protein
MKTLLHTAHELSDDGALRKSDNASLKSQINTLHENVFNLREHCSPESEIADPSKAASLRNPARNSVAVAVSGPAHTASPSKGFADLGIALDAASAVPSPKVSIVEEESDGFETVANKKKTTTGAPAVITDKHRRQPLVGVLNSASIPILSKKQRFRALFVSRFSVEVTADDVEEFLKEQSSLKKLIRIRPRTNLTLMHFFMFR